MYNLFLMGDRKDFFTITETPENWHTTYLYQDIFIKIFACISILCLLALLEFQFYVPFLSIMSMRMFIFCPRDPHIVETRVRAFIRVKFWWRINCVY